MIKMVIKKFNLHEFQLLKEDLIEILKQNQSLKFTYDIGHELVKLVVRNSRWERLGLTGIVNLCLTTI